MRTAHKVALRLVGGRPAAGGSAPTVVLSTAASEPVAAAFSVTATFSADVTGFVVGDITVTGGTLSAFTAVSGSIYTFTVMPTATLVTLSIAENVCDGAGNQASNTLEVDATTDVALRGQILALPGLVSYYPLNETSGTTADNAEGTAARDGTYAGSIPLNAVAFPSGGAAPNWQDTNDDLVVNNAGNLAAWSFETGWTLVFFKQNATGEGKLVFRADAAARDFEIQLHNTATYVNGFMRITGGVENAPIHQRHNDWTMVLSKWELSGSFKSFLQGALIKTVAHTAAAATITNMSVGRSVGFRGGVAHFAFGAGAVPTDAQIDAIYKAVYPTTHKGLFVCGDSFATDNDYWIDTILASARTADGNAHREAPYRYGLSGQRMAAIASGLATNFAASVITAPHRIIIAGGTNDVVAPMTDEATYKAALNSALDTLQAPCPDADIYKYHPWRGDADYDAACLTIKQWDLDVIATRNAKVHAGVDGNANYKTNIATWSTDNIHPDTDAGRIGMAADWMTVLGI